MDANLEYIGVRSLAYFTLKVLPVIRDYAHSFFGLSLGLQPLCKTEVMNVLNSSTALA
jgi:hypothetical protein